MGNCVGNCEVCKIPIYDDEAFYNVGEFIFEGILCEECMADIHKCEQCGINQPYCSDCV